VSLKFDNKVMLDGFTYDFNRGDRIGIVGANGVGKVRACFVVSIQLLVCSFLLKIK